ncbi:hypothetical protein F5B22DRAFT_80650 [Xylaria bambusicola]|uniref:uncharacterized protein n=1 Tax=Xylaria bambusicola TaxID=326684 RepID=UPI002007FE38|nr:uncharacterized protein F5B22DRAFT_80650 [Xylaria bambusicola]KAI0518315.1 hypothetical protein F5B22DRAFT_80650 [Xylaria bambusicola]
MAYNQYNVYADDRRSSNTRRESYRPSERSYTAQRDSRDGRYVKEPGEIRSPHENRPPREHRRDNESPRPNNDATSNPSEGSRRIPKISAANLPNKPGDGPRINRINIVTDKHIATNPSPAGNSTAITMPDAKNPKLQETFQNAYSWGEKHHKRLLLRIRRDKLGQERDQHRQENQKFSKGADKYPPYRDHVLNEKFESIYRAVDDETQAVENEYRRDLERLVSSLMTTSEPATVNRQDPVIAALEAKVEQVSEQAAKQAEQIQSLLEENKKFSTLKSEYDALRSDHDALRSDHDALRSDHDALKSHYKALESKICTCEDKTHELQLQQADMTSENESLRKQLEDLRDDTQAHDVKLAQVAKQSTDAAKAQQASIESQKVFVTGLEERMAGIEAKLDDFKDYGDIKEKVDELDMSTLMEIYSGWGDNTYNLKTLLAEYSEHRDQNGCSISETFRSLRQTVNSLRVGLSNSPLSHVDTPSLTETIKRVVEPEIEAAKTLIETDNKILCEGRDRLIASMIDALKARVTLLEDPALGHSELSNRVHSLEQWRVQCDPSMDRSQGLNLVERVTLLEGKEFGHHIDRIDITVSKLSEDYDALKSDVSRLPEQDWVEDRLQQVAGSFGIYSEIVDEAKDSRRKLLALELAFVNLESKYQNLNTKQLAEHIVRLTNPGIEQRLGRLETRSEQLETKLSGSDRTTAYHTEQLNSLLKTVKSIGEKRTASPGQLDESVKKRRFEINGRHPSS